MVERKIFLAKKKMQEGNFIFRIIYEKNFRAMKSEYLGSKTGTLYSSFSRKTFDWPSKICAFLIFPVILLYFVYFEILWGMLSIMHHFKYHQNETTKFFFLMKMKFIKEILTLKFLNEVFTFFKKYQYHIIGY